MFSRFFFHFEAPLKASLSLLFVVPKLQKSMGDLALMRLGMVANTISVAFFGIVWQPWQADLVDLSLFFPNKSLQNGSFLPT